MSSSERRNVLVSKQVTKEDLYRACHFKNTYVEDFFASAYDWTWAGGILAANLEFQDRERQAAIYLTQQVLSTLFGNVEIGMLRRVQSKIEAFRADYNYDQFSQIESSLNRVRFRINDLFKNEKFNVAKANYRAQFLSHIEMFVFHAVGIRRLKTLLLPKLTLL